ncbi:MAG: hypothetical protein PVJ05_15490 [Candidatus Thorarchaeota archaeon]|jgi:hypothetical protein
MKNIEKLYLAIAAVLIIVAVPLMIDGHILGASTVAFARVLLITGICFVGSSRKTLGSLKRTQ